MAATLLSAGGIFAEAPHSATSGEIPDTSHQGIEHLTDIEMASLTGRGSDCAENVRTAGTVVVMIGVLGTNLWVIATGQVTIGLADLACAL
ncbi:MAG: hypothetical protein OXG81_16590 [Acidobacteria bacterium]|nr:hypothetical protein [Acidobacteriota bacterium]